MKKYYSPSSGGFYTTSIHTEIPSDAIEITDELHSVLIEGVNSGKAIVMGGDGKPALTEPPPPTPDQEWETFKLDRAAQVARIVVTTSSGRVFDGDEDSQNRMARAVTVGNPGDTTEWKLADNTTAIVTAEELKEALYLAGLEQTRIWMSFSES